MHATQATETRLFTTLRLNGDELNHLIDLARSHNTAAFPDENEFLPIIRGWQGETTWYTNHENRGWLAEWYLTWQEANAAAVQAWKANHTIPGIAPTMDNLPFVASPEQMAVLVRLTSLETNGPIQLHAQMKDLYAGVLAWGVARTDDAEPVSGYHVATDTEVTNSGNRSFVGQSRDEGTAQILSKWMHRDQLPNLIPLADPDGRVFALVIGHAEVNLMVQALNTWS